MRDVFKLEPTTTIFHDDPYIASYPHLLDYFRSKGKIEVSEVVCGSHMVYGWMPTVLELYPDVEEGTDLAAAARLLMKAKAGDVLDGKEIGSLAGLVNNSLVGASKLLHFVAPRTYAIWDSKVFSFVHEKPPHNYRVNNVRAYQDYLQVLGELAKRLEFQPFHASVNKKVGYDVSAMRALELVMFLNAPVRARPRS
jgi:hypothetical protein